MFVKDKIHYWNLDKQLVSSGALVDSTSGYEHLLNKVYTVTNEKNGSIYLPNEPLERWNDEMEEMRRADEN